MTELLSEHALYIYQKTESINRHFYVMIIFNIAMVSEFVSLLIFSLVTLVPYMFYSGLSYVGYVAVSYVILFVFIISPNSLSTSVRSINLLHSELLLGGRS